MLQSLTQAKMMVSPQTDSSFGLSLGPTQVPSQIPITAELTVTGHRSPVTGHWSLVTGHWSLDQHIIMAFSLPEQLRRLRHSRGDSPLFCCQPSRNNTGDEPLNDEETRPLRGGPLTYRRCWQLVADHRRWLRAAIAKQHRAAMMADRGVASSDDAVEAKDVVVGYLGNNAPDLLLSALACLQLTADGDVCPRATVLPAMINGRWTPAEVERALRPRRAEDAEDEDCSHGVHVTVLLYGSRYEGAAAEVVWLMNQRKETQMEDRTNNKCASSHFAVALPLPRLAEKYDHADDTIGSIQHESSPDQEEEVRNQLISNTSTADALLLFTSGTSSPSGSAKGVRLSHRSLLIQAHAKTQDPCRYDARTRVAATTVPWHHVGGISSALAVILSGGCLVFPPETGGEARSGSFRPGRVLQSVQPAPWTEAGEFPSGVTANTLVVVPAMLHAIVDFVQTNKNMFPTSVFPNVRLILVGGQSIGNGTLHKQTRRLFPNARIVQTYACTEAGSSITFEDLGWNHNHQENRKSDSSCEKVPAMNGVNAASTCVGSPPAHILIGIFEAASRASHGIPNDEGARPAPLALLPSGRIGIIGTRGPHVMSGYWKRDGGAPDDKALGWLLTNDLGYVHPHSGKLFFCGRADDVIRTGGESVLATEVERVLNAHADIVECAVFALPDAKFGEAVCAAVVSKTPPKAVRTAAAVACEEEERTQWIRQHCARRQLAGYKRPRRVFWVRSLPRNSSGKVLKHTIIRQCASRTMHKSCL